MNVVVILGHLCLDCRQSAGIEAEEISVYSLQNVSKYVEGKATEGSTLSRSACLRLQETTQDIKNS